MKQDWEIYRDTGILGAALAGKEKLDEYAAREEQKENQQYTIWPTTVRTFDFLEIPRDSMDHHLSIES